MKTIVKTTFTVLFMLLMMIPAKAQDLNDLSSKMYSWDYSNAIGVRAGYNGALTLKHKFGSTALEGMIEAWDHGIRTRLLLENHVPAFDVTGLQWYYGAGGHLSFSNAHWHNGHENHSHPYHHHYYGSEMGLGVDGVLGIEYKIPPIPFAISVDVIPQIEVVTDGRVWGTIEPGVGIKFAF